MDARPVGVFDSGFGGLTVVRALADVVPGEDIVYVGDTGRYPYGPRHADEVRAFAAEIGESLVGDFGVKMVVVACNTASAVALDDLVKRLPVPVTGVIDPGVRAAIAATASGRVGVIGTVGTIGSGAYQQAFATAAPEVELACAACPGFVEFVERGDTGSDELHVLAERLLAPVCDAQVDTLLLGCTHYPFLARTIGDVMGRDVVLVSSADETAFDVAGALRDMDLGADALRSGRCRYVSSGDVTLFAARARILVGGALGPVEAWCPGTRGEPGKGP